MNICRHQYLEMLIIFSFSTDYENVLNYESLLCLFQLQFPNKSLLLAVCAACIGGTFQYGYNLSIINAPTQVITILTLNLSIG